MNAKDLFDQLNATDEVTEIEAKPSRAITSSVMETVCAFANEPGLGGGYILIGARKDPSSLFPQYIIDPILDPDKIQSDFATQCASSFNIPIRSEIRIEKVNDKTVAVIKVPELPKEQKPLYFKSKGLPEGAYRRIGPTDHRCTEDDLPIFYSDQKTFDQSPLDYTSIADIDEVALKRYRDLRTNINPAAEELTYSDSELLQSLGGIAIDGSQRITVSGMLLFGKLTSLRRVFPMMRVDYIRIPGNEWIANPDERFTTVDMRGPLLTLVFRIVDAIYSDLPKGFRLEDKDIQADTIGMPVKALREAVTNALMHRSYRVNSPIQVIRYDNRLEIVNPGFSLKSEEQLGSPGSETRNPYIAAVFHETNLAETKGSGIKAMRKLLSGAHLAPPTFESDRVHNKFTARLLLHHFLSKSDLDWLANYGDVDLNDKQKQALIFVREVGAIDNNTYRQLSDIDTLKASTELRYLRDNNLLKQLGKGRGTYYVAGDRLDIESSGSGSASVEIAAPGSMDMNAESSNTEDSTVNTEGLTADNHSNRTNTEANTINTEGETLWNELTPTLQTQLNSLKKRENNAEKIKNIIVELCSLREYRLSELALLIGKDENWISRTYIKPLIQDGRLSYTIQEMISHPKQAYKAK
ncbi:MAG: putative DNA binding domain-containing protein [Flavobacteriales bacterium]|nr:putative DNA binding domain-containing protein [Flavobacteriales bacterium]MCB9449270.1 putative DNA binding domain-containing protein [Flavobacteriales bacterium]